MSVCKNVCLLLFCFGQLWAIFRKDIFFSCAPGRWPGVQLYILGMSLSESESWKCQKVENICQYRCQDSGIWHGASLGTLIKIQKEPIWRTMWGPCFDHKNARFHVKTMFWPYRAILKAISWKEGYIVTHQCELWCGTSLQGWLYVVRNPISYAQANRSL